MQILVINCGSSSIKADVIDTENGEHIRSARVERVGSEQCQIKLDQEVENLPRATHESALQALMPKLIEGIAIKAVGHRVVHGGESFHQAVEIDDTALQQIVELEALAPLHMPANLSGIRIARTLLNSVPHIAVFDTAFHSSLPRRAKTYALPQELRTKHGVRRYGFHGTSHQWVAKRAAQHLEEPIENLRLITCHLGNGASVCAIEYGRSIETSMGMTPLEGLVMGTRVGDIDAGVLMHLLREEKIDVDDLDQLLNKQSGLAGLSNIGCDMRDIEARAAEGDDACRLAIAVFTHRIRKYIGAYAAVLGGVDAIVFTAGIGENSASIRHRICQRLDFLGARIDEDLNRDAKLSLALPCAAISERNSRTRLLVVATDEARAIAEITEKIVNKAQEVADPGTIPIAVSARHIHLTRDAVDALFGQGYQLTPDKDLSQPGQFACKERLTIIGPKNSIEGVRVLGPERSKCQVEISRTDEFLLGVDAPVRDSGDVEHSPGITLKGPAGTLTLKQGLICARRHIHMTPEDAKRFGVKHGDVVEIAIDSNKRDLIFGDVLIRVSRKYQLEMHLDTDEANAAEIMPGIDGALVRTEGSARLLQKRIGRDELPSSQKQLT